MNISTGDFLNEKILRILFLLIPLCNFTLFKIGGFRGIIILEFIIIILFIVNLKIILRKRYMFFLWALSIFWLKGLYSVIDIKEFFMSYITYIFYILFLFIIFNTAPTKRIIGAIVSGITIVAGYGIIQFIILNIGSLNFNDIVRMPFGNGFTFQLLPESYMSGIARANSLFYEPSIYGAFCVLGLAIILTFKDFNKLKYKIIFIVGILTSLSATAYIALLGIISIGAIFYKRNLFIKYIYTVLGIVAVINLYTMLVGDRLLEIFEVGTSTFYRFIAPMFLIKELVLEKFYFGVPLGQIELYIKENQYWFMYMNGNGISTSVDNGLAIIALYFGVFSIIIYYKLFRYLKKELTKKNIYLIVAAIMIILTTGALNFIYFNIFMGAVILSIKYNKLLLEK